VIKGIKRLFKSIGILQASNVNAFYLTTFSVNINFTFPFQINENSADIRIKNQLFFLREGTL